MPYKDKSIERKWFTISEVAKDLGVATSNIRYWEKEFPESRARKRYRNGDRKYSKRNIEVFRKIKGLKITHHNRGVRIVMGWNKSEIK